MSAASTPEKSAATLPRRCLQMDVGNSGGKWRLLLEGALFARGVYRATDKASRAELLGSSEDLDAIWISSVASDAADGALSQLLQQRWGLLPWFARSEAQTQGLINSYAQPAKLGVDRWLAMLAARQLLPGRIAVIDAGSALTIDLVAADGRHEGGYIIPGVRLMERALLLDTDRVRFEESPEYGLAPGVSTAEAVRHGIALAQVGAVQVALREAGLAAQQCVFTGGGGRPLQQLAQLEGHYVGDLVLDGLVLMAASQSPQ